MRITEKQYQYRTDYNKAAYDRLCYRSRKDDKIPDRISMAAKLHNITPAKYVLQAIETALQADGVTLDSLPADEGGDTKTDI